MNQNSNFAVLDSLDLEHRVKRGTFTTLKKTESWEIGGSPHEPSPGYPSLVKNDYGVNPDGKFYLFYSVHDAPAGIGVAVSDELRGPYIKRRELLENAEDSRILNAPKYPRETSHFSSPVVIWNPERQRWHMYFHFYRPEIGRGYGHQKTAVAFSDGLASGKWEIYRDQTNRYIVPLPTAPEWANSQSSYHAIARIGVNEWIALLRGTSLFSHDHGEGRKVTTSLSIARSKDGIQWSLVKPAPFATEDFENLTLKPISVIADYDGNLAVIWSTVKRIHETKTRRSRAYMAHIDDLENPVRILPDWEPRDGASSIKQVKDELFIFSGDKVFIYSNPHLMD